MAEAALQRPVDWSGFPPYVPLGMRRPIPPKPPSEAVNAVVEPVQAPELTEVTEVSTASAAPSGAVGDAACSTRGATMRLDIRFWRGRWFWRLGATATVRSFHP
jgi:hypothetical protein